MICRSTRWFISSDTNSEFLQMDMFLKLCDVLKRHFKNMHYAVTWCWYRVNCDWSVACYKVCCTESSTINRPTGRIIPCIVGCCTTFFYLTRSYFFVAVLFLLKVKHKARCHFAGVFRRISSHPSSLAPSQLRNWKRTWKLELDGRSLMKR